MKRRRHLAVALCLAAVLGGGCGTTVPLGKYTSGGGYGTADGPAVNPNGLAGSPDGSGSTGGGQGGGLGGNSGAASPGASGNTSIGLGNAPGGSGPAGSGYTGAVPAANGSGPAGTAPVGSGPGQANGPGVSATTINVAAAYDPNSGTENQVVGATGTNPGDARTQTNAVVNYINAHGGIGGRKINLIWFQINDTQQADALRQSACSYWTQDNKTFVLAGGSPIYDQCTAKAGGIGPYSYYASETTAILQQYPADINVSGFTIDRSEKVTVEGLADQGYFNGAKVGVITWDDPAYHYGIDNAAKPALARAGVANSEIDYLPVPSSYNDLGATSAAIGSAVLKFRSDGIDHVVIFDGAAGITGSGFMTLEWMQAANSQRYYPRYGMNTLTGLSSIAADVPAAQLANAIGIGWSPALDLDTVDYAALPSTPQQNLCIQLMTAAGQAPSNGNERSTELSTCDGFFFLQAALGKVKGPLNQATALAAIDGLGSSYQDLTTFGIDITATQHDGATLVRNAAFNGSCDCFKYTSAAYNPG